MTMIDNQENDDRWIDRLVDGELAEDERRALLARFDTDPDGWRRCALAFLEAQAWRETFGPVAVAAEARPRPATVATLPKAARTPAARTLVAVAASVLVAFGAGRLSSRQADPPTTVVARPDTGPERVTPPPPEPEPGPIAKQEPPPPDPVVTRLESRGYRVDRRQGVVAVEAPGGRRVAVPVAGVRLRYVGDRTY